MNSVLRLPAVTGDFGHGADENFADDGVVLGLCYTAAWQEAYGVVQNVMISGAARSQ